jgi:hypothetical protein
VPLDRSSGISQNFRYTSRKKPNPLDSKLAFLQFIADNKRKPTIIATETGRNLNLTFPFQYINKYRPPNIAAIRVNLLDIIDTNNNDRTANKSIHKFLTPINRLYMTKLPDNITPYLRLTIPNE